MQRGLILSLVRVKKRSAGMKEPLVAPNELINIGGSFGGERWKGTSGF
jgi:hypothetical protein